MQRLLTSFALFLALGLSAGEATALGFGKVNSAATLGQPLNFSIGLRLDPNESIEARCIKAEVTLGDRTLPDAVVRTRLETAAASGERRARVTTTIPVDEPVVNIQLQVGCPSSLSRSFMVFADPPVRGAVASGNAPAEEGWTSERAESPVNPVLAAVPPSAPASEAGRSNPRARKRSGDSGEPNSRAEVAASTRTAGAGSGARSRVRSAEPRLSGGAVLRLDPVEADALIFPSLQMATKLSEPPDPSASGAVPQFVDPEQQQRLREQERLKAMEATLLKLRTDSEATQKSLFEMQQRVRAAEAARYANPLVYLLLFVCALLAAGLVGMGWLRRRDRLAGAWWTPPSDDAAAPEPAAAAAVAGDVDLAPLPVPESAPMPAPRPEPVPPMFAPLSPSMPAPLRSAESEVVEPRRPMSAEELIDLEQQAEFFVVLGQDDAAIDLLMGHVRSTGGVSPLPYLKLLEIYRRRGEREPYDRMRERFNRRFNAYAPEWDVDPEMGLSLEGYPEVMSRLQRAWATPSQAMELLDASLFRRDAGPTFDVPAYRELLFLYGMSRDLAERDTGPEGVDLLLPFDDSRPASTFTSVPPTLNPPPLAPPSFSLDLDVSTDQPPLLSLDDTDFKKSKR
ncbi:type IV pilus assembly protein FimV [Sphaerotilaceae bacterium SBD11-9]